MRVGPNPYHDKHDMPDDLVWIDILGWLGILAAMTVIVVVIIKWVPWVVIETGLLAIGLVVALFLLWLYAMTRKG